MAKSTQSGLIKTSLSLSLTGGVDRKTDPKQLTNGQMYTADNVQYITEGQIRKRFGYVNLTPPGGLQGAPFAAVGCRDNVEPLVLGTGALNRYNVTTGLSTSIPANTQGRYTSQPITSSSGIGDFAQPPLDATCATDNQKYICVAYQEPQTASSNMFYGIQDLLTGAWIISPLPIPKIANTFSASSVTYTVTGVTAPRVVYSNGYFYILYAALGSNTSGSTTYAEQLQCYAINLLNLSAGLIATNFTLNVATAQTTTPQAYLGFGYDATVFNNILYVATTSATTTGSGQVNAYTMSGATFTLQTTGTFTGQSTPANYYSRVAIAVNSSYVGVATSISFVVMNSALVQQSRYDFNTSGGAALVGTPPAVVWNGNLAYIFWPLQQTYSQMIYCPVYNAATRTLVTSANINAPSLAGTTGILSKPFIFNNKVYIWIYTQGYGSYQVYRSQVLCEYDSNANRVSFVARTAYQTAALMRNDIVAPTEVINLPSTSRFVTFLSQTSDAVGTANYYGTLNRGTIDFAPSYQSRLYSLPSGGVFVAGAFPLYYDGQSINEAGYTNSPELNILGTSNAQPPTVYTTGGSMLAGTYNYYLCFLRRDAYGNVIRSSPSAAYTVTTTGSTSRVVFPVLSYYNQSNVYIEIYRTTIASPSQPYYVGKVAAGDVFTDTSSDSGISGNANIYTYSGEYPNDPPPAVHSMAIGETRAYIIPSDSRNVIWCSKKFSPGRAVEWTSNLILSEGGTHSGNFTAIAVLDTNVIVFKQDQILYFYGDGPDNTGANGTFSAFQRLSSDVGCIDPGSLAIIPGGLLFRSQRGIELLTRGLQVEYVGFPIEPIVQSITTIASAVVMPQYEQVRFIPSVTGQPVLVFDYLKNRWSTYSAMAALSAANVLGNYWWISSDGSTCNIETPNAFLDAGTNFITMTLETPEIPSVALQGWGRVYRIGVLGEMRTSHVLTTSFAYDHQETYTHSIVYTPVSSNDASAPTSPMSYDNQGKFPVAYVTVPGPLQFRFSRVPRQVMQTLRLKLQDAPLTVYTFSDVYQPTLLQIGESCAISNITLEVGQKALLAKLPGSQTV